MLRWIILGLMIVFIALFSKRVVKIFKEINSDN